MIQTCRKLSKSTKTLVLFKVFLAFALLKGLKQKPKTAAVPGETSPNSVETPESASVICEVPDTRPGSGLKAVEGGFFWRSYDRSTHWKNQANNKPPFFFGKIFS